jgi:hypothetical protein
LFAEIGLDQELLLDFIEVGLFIPLFNELRSLSCVQLLSLFMLVRVDELSAIDFRFLNAVIFRMPLRKPELLLFSTSDEIASAVCDCGTNLSDTIEDCVTGRCSLEAHEVGAVDCDCMEACLLKSDAMVEAESEEVMPSISVVTWSGRSPRSWT